MLSQSFVITKIVTEDYPTLNCEYMILDESGRKIAPQQTDMQLTENGIDQSIINLNCQLNKNPEPVSVVLTIDNSASMSQLTESGQTRLELIKIAAKRFVNLLHSNTEIALTHFGADTYRDLSYTFDKNLVNNTINTILPNGGGTDINKALTHSDGSIASTKGANYKKIIVFLTDGEDRNLKKEQLISMFIDNNVTLYTVSIYTKMDNELVEISEETGGMAFNNIQGDGKIVSVFEALANIISGLDLCRLDYVSNNCDIQRMITLSYKDQFKDSTRITLSKSQLVEYETNPKKLDLYKNNNQSNIINIVSSKDTLIVTNIQSLYSSVEISEPNSTAFPIKLAIGEKLKIKVTNPNDDFVRSDLIKISSNSCENQDIVIQYKPVEQNLEVKVPNGGEQYSVGSSINLVWSDESKSSSYKIDYSTDAGYSWSEIIDNYNDLSFPWEKIPDTPTEDALLRVTEGRNRRSLVQTHSLGLIDSTPISKVEKIIPYTNNRYILMSRFRDKFQYRNLSLDTNGQKSDFKSYMRLVILILDENLDVLKYKSLVCVEDNFHITNINDDIYLLLNNPYLIAYDTLNYIRNENANNNGVLLKIDPNLDLVDYKIIDNKNPLTKGIKYYLSLKSSQNYLHLIGATNRNLDYDGVPIIDDQGSLDIYYIARINSNLTLDRINYWDFEKDKLNFYQLGMQVKSDNDIVIWGVGSGDGYLGLDTNYSRFLAMNYNYDDNRIRLKNYLSFKSSVDFTAMDYLSFKDINYYSIQTNKATYYDNENKTIGNDDHFVRVIAYNDNYELLWERTFDEDAKDKNLALFESNSILMGGRTNERIIFENDTINRNQNTILVTSLNPYNGNLNWVHHLEEPIYTGNLITNDNKIILSGFVNKSLDFGNKYYSNIDPNSSHTKEFIWSLEYNPIISDISDSLWAINKAKFSIIDTIDFGKVYIGSRKDSLIDGFIRRLLPGNVTINSITIDDARFTTNFSNPIILEDKIDLRVQLNSDISGSNLARGTIKTSIGDYYFYVLSEEIGGNSSFLWSYKELDIDFGNVDILQNKKISDWVIRNKDEAVIGIDSIRIVGDTYDQFSYIVSPSENHIYAFDTLESDFVYTPKISGPSQAEVEYYLDISREPVVAKLRGNGISKDSIRGLISVDTLSGFPESLTFLPIRIKITDNPKSLSLSRLEVDIEYNATLLLPFRFDNEGTVTNKIRRITIPINESDIKTKLVEKRFLPTIGNAISTDIRIVGIRAYNQLNEEILANKIATENGQFVLNGVCFTNGQYRLYSDGSPYRIDIVEENGEFFVDYNLIEDGFINLSIYDINGKLLTTLVAKDLGKGEHRTEIGTKNISNGNYILRLETKNQNISKIFTITK